MTTRIAVLGTGYWAQFQVGAWRALGVPVVAVWNRTRERAEAFASRFSIPKVFDTPEALFDSGQFDLADIIAGVEAHEPLVLMAARYGKPVICQKPMSDTLASCRRMVRACEEAGVWFAIHENFRYQPPIQAFKQALDSGVCGRLERAHLIMRSPDRAFFRAQPALLTMDHMALRDMGPHILDVARYLFGEIATLTTVPLVAYSDLPIMTGALTLLRTVEGLPVQCDLTHQWPFQMLAVGEHGSLLLDNEFRLHATTADGEMVTDTRTWEVLPYIAEDEWALHGGHVFTAVQACLADLLAAFRSGVPAATSGAETYRTMQAMFAAILSSDEGRTVAPAELG